MNEQCHPLKHVALKVLEDWAMMLVDENDEITPQSLSESGSLYISSTHFKGTISGTVSIVSPKSFLRVLAANLLGESGDETPGEEDCIDAFREMGNVLTGNFLTEAYGDDVVFDLLSPQVSTASEDHLDELTARKVVFSFNADEEPVVVTFQLD